MLVRRAIRSLLLIWFLSRSTGNSRTTGRNAHRPIHAAREREKERKQRWKGGNCTAKVPRVAQTPPNTVWMECLWVQNIHYRETSSENRLNELPVYRQLISASYPMKENTELTSVSASERGKLMKNGI